MCVSVVSRSPGAEISLVKWTAWLTMSKKPEQISEILSVYSPRSPNVEAPFQNRRPGWIRRKSRGSHGRVSVYSPRFPRVEIPLETETVGLILWWNQSKSPNLRRYTLLNISELRAPVKPKDRLALSLKSKQVPRNRFSVSESRSLSRNTLVKQKHQAVFEDEN